MTGQRILAEDRLDVGVQSVEGATHVDRLDRHEDPGGGGQDQHRASLRSLASSAPPRASRQRIRRPCAVSISIAHPGAWAAGPLTCTSRKTTEGGSGRWLATYNQKSRVERGTPFLGGEPFAGQATLVKALHHLQPLGGCPSLRLLLAYPELLHRLSIASKAQARPDVPGLPLTDIPLVHTHPSQGRF